MATKTARPKALGGTESKPEPQRDPCLCGCGGFPMGRKSRFIPGHDARYHSALKKAATEAVAVESAPVQTDPDEWMTRYGNLDAGDQGDWIKGRQARSRNR